MRVGSAFSRVLDPSSEPLFADQGPLDLLPEEVWHTSARAAPTVAAPDSPNSTLAGPRQGGESLGGGEEGKHMSDADTCTDSDDSLQPYDLPEDEDAGAC